MLKKFRFLSLLINSFPFVREFRLRKKIRLKRIKMSRRLSRDDAKHLRRYILMSGTIRRL